jgi:hypothetical protein
MCLDWDFVLLEASCELTSVWSFTKTNNNTQLLVIARGWQRA